MDQIAPHSEHIGKWDSELAGIVASIGDDALARCRPFLLPHIQDVVLNGLNAGQEFGHRLTRGLSPDGWLLVGKLKSSVRGEEGRKSIWIVGVN